MFTHASEAVQWITSLYRFGQRPGLERISSLLERFGHPERHLRFIHVAGTNGKGSVCAYLHEVLRQCGYDVGMFTSPYLDRYANRIRFNGEAIPDDSLLKWANELYPIAQEMRESEHGSPTMFEISVAIAVLYFAKEAYPDFVIWETGLGGRLDCTNIVYPIVSVITNIGDDHTDVLGNTIREIAAEKAGIIKPGVPVVTAAEQDEALQVIAETAARNRSALYILGKTFDYRAIAASEREQVIEVTGPFRSFGPLAIRLCGLYQQANAAVAWMVLEILRQYYALVAEDEDLLEGFRKTQWPGRMELVSDHPRLLLDGAHNPDGARELAKSIRSVYSYKKLHFLVGMQSAKNHPGVFQHILPLADSIIVTKADFMGAADSGILAEKAAQTAQSMGLSLSIEAEEDWRRALQSLLERIGPEDLGVVMGSLYLISDVRSAILNEGESEKGW